ncbi:MAG: hydantoinase/oxoprolinase family protein [Candidatus Lustribacter sp.]
MALHVALDIGGTFTDLIAFDEEADELRHAKSSTTPDDLTVGIFRCLAKGGVTLGACETFVHGATVAINTLIEGTGARTVLVTTAGARDVYAIGRGNRPEAYNVFFRRAEPLVPRHRIIEVRERLGAAGNVIEALTPETVGEACDRVAELEPAAIAVCLLHSYANPEHEELLGRALRERFPGVYVSLSHEILRQYREYERTSTTVVNSYIGPRVSGYLQALDARLQADAFAGSLLIMQSNGGVTSVASASRVPVGLMESGPVGGINASAEIGKRLGFEHVIAFDMGGTTAKASLIRDGEPAIAEGYYVGGYASGHPVMLPVVDVVEVGAGGGSIGWIDEVGALKVGPRSAGAKPGPVCYGTGGTEPTITDANLVLGRLDGRNFLGGEMPLDAGAARDALATKLARPLGLTVEEAALGMLRIAVAHMTLAVRGVSIERGYDPRDFVMIASGGNGGLHAGLIARELSIPKVILPVLPAHCSAVGMLMTDIRHDYVRTHPLRLAEADFGSLAGIFDDFEAAGMRLLETEGVSPAAREIRRSLDVRYVGQEYYLNLPVARAEISGADRAAIRTRFDESHARHYGQNEPGQPVEIVNVRVSAHGKRKRLPIRVEGAAANGATIPFAERDVVLDDFRRPVRARIYQRDDLRMGTRITGPAIIEEAATTTLLLAGDVAQLCADGSILVEIAA